MKDASSVANQNGYTILVAPPIVVSSTTGTIANKFASTITFLTENLVNDNTRPFVKLVPSSTDCDAANGIADAISYAQVEYTSPVEGSIIITTPPDTIAQTMLNYVLVLHHQVFIPIQLEV